MLKANTSWQTLHVYTIYTVFSCTMRAGTALQVAQPCSLWLFFMPFYTFAILLSNLPNLPKDGMMTPPNGCWDNFWKDNTPKIASGVVDSWWRKRIAGGFLVEDEKWAQLHFHNWTNVVSLFFTSSHCADTIGYIITTFPGVDFELAHLLYNTNFRALLVPFWTQTSLCLPKPSVGRLRVKDLWSGMKGFPSLLWSLSGSQ